MSNKVDIKRAEVFDEERRRRVFQSFSFPISETDIVQAQSKYSFCFQSLEWEDGGKVWGESVNVHLC